MGKEPTSIFDTIEKEYGNMSEFLGKGCELYRSIDHNMTSLYFTDYKDYKTEEEYYESKSFFEVLLVKESSVMVDKILVRYPNTDYFIELQCNSSSSSHGYLFEGGGTNLWGKIFKRDIKIKTDGNILMLSNGSCTDFNFLKKVGSLEEKNPYVHNDIEKHFNYDEVKKSLELKYLKLPSSLYKIEYAYGNYKFHLISVYPAYNFQYDNHRLFAGTINNMKEYEILDIKRYRDGGTTYIKCKDKETGQETTLYSPSDFISIGDGFDNMPKEAMWGDLELDELDNDYAHKLAESLGLLIAPDLKKQEEDYLNSIDSYSSKKTENIYAVIDEGSHGIISDGIVGIFSDKKQAEKSIADNQFIIKTFELNKLNS